MGYFIPMCTALVCALVAASQALKVRPCNQDTSSYSVRDVSVSVNPHPVMIPGGMTLALGFTVARPIKGRLDAEVSIHRWLGPIRIRVPCIPMGRGRIGSCTYRDLCRLIPPTNATCPAVMSNNNIPCSCPFPAGTYGLAPTRFNLNPRKFSGIIAGSYEATIKLKDADTSAVLSCYDVSVQLKDPQSNKGFFSSLFSSMIG